MTNRLNFSRFAIRSIGGIGVSLMFGWAAASLLRQIDDLNVLRNEGRDAAATVVKTECADHGKVEYQFIVNGRDIIGQSNDCGIICNSLMVGTEITIRYDPSRIALNSCGIIQQKMNGAILLGYWLLAVATIVLVTLFFIPFKIIYRLRKF